MKQLLLQNCILLDDELFNLDGNSYTVKHFLDSLNEESRGTRNTVKKKILSAYGKRFKNKNEVLSYLAEVARQPPHG